MSTSFSDINNVSDIFKYNDSDPIKKVLEIVYNHEPGDGKYIVEHIIGQLCKFHRDTIKEFVEQGDVEKVAVWSYDLSRLEGALGLLEDVECWVTENSLNKLTSLLLTEMTALSPSYFPSVEDMEEFASDYLKLNGTDTDMYYEACNNLNDNDQYFEEEYRSDELNQTQWEYWKLDKVSKSLYTVSVGNKPI